MKKHPESEPLHPFEVVAFACVGYVLAVLLTMLAANKFFGQEFGYAPGWVALTTGQPMPATPAKQ